MSARRIEVVGILGFASCALAACAAPGSGTGTFADARPDVPDDDVAGDVDVANDVDLADDAAGPVPDATAPDAAAEADVAEQPEVVVCGDGDCNGTETCQSCVTDCGECPVECAETCELWTATCAGDNGYRLCVPDADSACAETSYFIACQPGNTCGASGCTGGCVVPELMLLVDRSSSMIGPVWDFSRAELIAFAQRIAPGARVGIRAFPGSDACDPGVIVPLALDAADAIAAALVEPATVSATPLSAAFSGVAAHFGDPDQGEHVVLMSDGSETCAEVGDVAREARRVRARGARVHAIGIGASYDGELLAEVAAEGGGRFYAARDRAALEAALRKLTEEITGCDAPAGGLAYCHEGACLASCGEGAHACDDTCVDDTATATCGAGCSPCPAPVHGNATCDGVRCGVACDPDFHACGDTCAADSAVASCGDRCAPCPDVDNGYPTCDGTRCGFACDDGFHACGERCVSDFDVATCGDRCSPCPTAASAAATCDGAQCGLDCADDFHACGLGCASDDADATCGTRCAPCTAPLFGSSGGCVAERCEVTCEPGRSLCDAEAACCLWEVEQVDSVAYTVKALGVSDAGEIRMITDPGVYLRKTANGWVESDSGFRADASAFTATGDPVIVDWEEDTEAGTSDLTIVRRSGNQWVARGVTVTNQIWGAELAIDAAGTAHVIYKHITDLVTYETALEYRSQAPGAAWSAATVIRSNVAISETVSAVLLSPSGQVCVAYVGYDEAFAQIVEYTCGSAAGFVSETVASDADVPRGPIALGFDHAGSAHLAFAEWTFESPVVVRRRIAAGNWHKAVFETSRYPAAFQLAGDRDGRLRLVVADHLGWIELWRFDGATWTDLVHTGASWWPAESTIHVAFEPDNDPVLWHDSYLNERALLTLVR